MKPILSSSYFEHYTLIPVYEKKLTPQIGWIGHCSETLDSGSNFEVDRDSLCPKVWEMPSFTMGCIVFNGGKQQQQYSNLLPVVTYIGTIVMEVLLQYPCEVWTFDKR